MARDWSTILKGALKGGLIGGGVGFGIPASYHTLSGNMDFNNLAGSARFGLLTSIPGALIGALLASPNGEQELQHPNFYLDSPESEEDLLYKDFIKAYNDNVVKGLNERDIKRMLYTE